MTRHFPALLKAMFHRDRVEPTCSISSIFRAPTMCAICESYCTHGALTDRILFMLEVNEIVYEGEKLRTGKCLIDQT